jgi:hypothetical protein
MAVATQMQGRQSSLIFCTVQEVRASFRIWSRVMKLDFTTLNPNVSGNTWNDAIRCSQGRWKQNVRHQQQKLFLQSFVMKRHYSGKLLPQERQQRYLVARINSINLNARLHQAHLTRNISEISFRCCIRQRNIWSYVSQLLPESGRVDPTSLLWRSEGVAMAM